jgi:hypothetical protein
MVKNFVPCHGFCGAYPALFLSTLPWNNFCCSLYWCRSRGNFMLFLAMELLPCTLDVTLDSCGAYHGHKSPWLRPWIFMVQYKGKFLPWSRVRCLSPSHTTWRTEASWWAIEWYSRSTSKWNNRTRRWWWTTTTSWASARRRSR